MVASAQTASTRLAVEIESSRNPQARKDPYDPCGLYRFPTTIISTLRLRFCVLLGLFIPQVLFRLFSLPCPLAQNLELWRGIHIRTPLSILPYTCVHPTRCTGAKQCTHVQVYGSAECMEVHGERACSRLRMIR